MPDWTVYREIDGIRVFHVDLQADAAREEHALEWLSDSEQAQAMRYRNEKSRRHYALTQAAVRAIICERLKCRNDSLSFEKQSHGKPHALLEGSPAPISFNITHSGTHGLIAIASEIQLGVDLEIYSTRRNLEGLSKRVFGAEERAAFAVLPKDERIRLFYRIWTMKEALLKALDTGLSLNPAKFQIPLEMLEEAIDSGALRFPHDPTDKWKLKSMCEDRFAAALAWKAPPK